jgi:hypothetical protein
MSGRYWVENVGGSGVVVGPYNTAPTGMNLTNLIGYPNQAQAQTAASQLSTVQAKVGSAASSLGSGVVNDALKPLFQAHIWLRVAEVVAGLVLIAIGLNSMLKGKPLSVVSSTAGLASKVVPRLWARRRAWSSPPG